jgi:magnesium transporter
MTRFLSEEQLTELLVDGRSDVIRQALTQAHPHAVAEILETMPADEAWAVLCLDRLQDAAEVLSHLSAGQQTELAARQDTLTVATLLAAMPADDRADLIKSLPRKRQDELLAFLPKRVRLETEHLAGYPEGTAGSVMSTEFVTIDPNATALEALEHIRRVAQRTETIYYIYVTNRRQNLVGVVSLRDLILAEPEALIGGFMRTDVLFTRARDPREDAARTIRDYDLLALPVINRKDKLVGIVTVDDVLDFKQDEASN